MGRWNKMGFGGGKILLEVLEIALFAIFFFVCFKWHAYCI